MTSDRVYARLPSDSKEKLILAADGMGLSVNQFLVHSALEKAELLLEKIRTLKLNDERSLLFFDLMEYPMGANDHLKQVFQSYQLMDNQ